MIKMNYSRVIQKTMAITMAMALSLISLTGCGSNEPVQSGTEGSNNTETTTNNETSDSKAAESTAQVSASGESKVVVGLAHDPQNIGPFQGMSAGRIGILYTVYEFLVTTEGGEMKGVLMKDYEKIDDLTYTCEIYDYITDQLGNPVTAADVVFSYNTAMQSGNLPKLGSIDSVKVISDYVVEFKFNNLSIGDLGALWMECPIVTQAAYEASPDEMATDPISTTAYKCTEYVSGSKIVFTNTGNYWQTDASKINNTSKSNVDVIEFDIITDSAQLTNALKTSAIDVTNWLSDIDVADFQGMEGFEVAPIPDNTTYFLLFNCDGDQGAFADNEKFRQALAYAVDSQQLVDGALIGSGNVAKTWGNTNYSDYVSTWNNEDYYSYDLEKAKQLLAESGAAKTTLNLMITSTDLNTKLATIIQAQLALIGITVNISTYDSQLFNEYKYQPDQWDIMLDQGASTSYLVNVWKLNWDSSGYVHGGSENFVKDDKLQELLIAAMDVDNHNDTTMDAFHQYLKEQCYGIGLVQSMSNIAHTARISKITVDARGQVTPGACEYTF